jgi:glycosyltransferase involved in cell wall biosynthesis
MREFTSADVFLHPSFREGAASAVLEALGFGLPVVCQRRSGLRDLVDDGTGILLDARDPDELTDGIAAALLRLTREPGFGARLRATPRGGGADGGESGQAATLGRVYDQVLSGSARCGG